MNEYLNSKQYINKRVKIKYTNTKTYLSQGLIGKCGTIERVSNDCKSRGSIGVTVDGKINLNSEYGLFWFNKNELDFLENESEDIKMEGYKYVAIVNLLEDYNKKDYGFALYDEDLDLLVKTWDDNAIVVVNARGKNNRVLGIVKDIMPIESYNGAKPTAEVVGVVNMNGYIAREKEKVRLRELAEKKAAIERELEAEINKRKSVEYYEEMAKKYSDNPKLAELVAELKNLGA